MEFELAERLSRTHSELLHSISANELTEWRALQEVRVEEQEEIAKGTF